MNMVSSCVIVNKIPTMKTFAVGARKQWKGRLISPSKNDDWLSELKQRVNRENSHGRYKKQSFEQWLCFKNFSQYVTDIE